LRFGSEGLPPGARLHTWDGNGDMSAAFPHAPKQPNAKYPVKK